MKRRAVMMIILSAILLAGVIAVLSANAGTASGPLLLPAIVGLALVLGYLIRRIRGPQEA